MQSINIYITIRLWVVDLWFLQVYYFLPPKYISLLVCMPSSPFPYYSFFTLYTYITILLPALVIFSYILTVIAFHVGVVPPSLLFEPFNTFINVSPTYLKLPHIDGKSHQLMLCHFKLPIIWKELETLQ